MTFLPVTTLEELDNLDDEDVMQGYRSGRTNEPEPGHNRGRAFWHGWRNGMMDAGHMPHDDASRELARVAVIRMNERGYL